MEFISELVLNGLSLRCCVVLILKNAVFVYFKNCKNEI